MDDLKNILDVNAFLGRGWNFPPSLSKAGVKMVAYEEDIRQSLYVLFSTSPGERVNRYDYGCLLRRYAFEPMNKETTIRMRNEIARAITLFEPRISLEDVSFEEQAEEGILLIRISYTILRINSRSNMVYPFYLNEGTNTTR